MQINRLTILIHDQDAALNFFVTAFGWECLEDHQVSSTKRIVRVAPQGSDVTFNLATPKPGDESIVGRQAGQRVFGFIDTNDLNTDLNRFRQQGVTIVDGPRIESFGHCVLVEDLVGNIWEFVERT